MNLYDIDLYMQDIAYVASLDLPWDRLQNSSFLITGASGLVGSFLVDVLMLKNTTSALNCKIYAIGRNQQKAEARFGKYLNNKCFAFISCDVNKPLDILADAKVDFVLHLASNTHPLAYSSDPIGTITTNVIGLYNLLEFAAGNKVKRFAFASSNEIYGENRGDEELFKEDYCGYIDCNTMRAGYPESKRCGEALCQAYLKQAGLDIVIPRLTRSYGPTLLNTDSKALSQFLHKALAKEDIVLKSAGNQYFSYTYVADAVSGLLTVLLAGKTGEAYNISYDKSDIRLKDLAAIIADFAGKKVIFEIPDAAESVGYSKATKARLDSTKLQNLGWSAKYDINLGITNTLKIMEKLTHDTKD